MTIGQKIEVLTNIIQDVQKELSMQYNILSGENKNFSGLCNLASEMILQRLKDYSDSSNKIKTKLIHGEQNPNLAGYKAIEHTWAEIYWQETKFYVDATSQQFQYIYADIPDYYISTKPPKWFLADRDNPEIQKLKVQYKQDVHWVEPIHSVWKSLYKDVERFSELPFVICEYSCDDSDKKWWLSAIIEGDTVGLSLETQESIIESASVASQESLIATVQSMLDRNINELGEIKV